MKPIKEIRASIMRALINKDERGVLVELEELKEYECTTEERKLNYIIREIEDISGYSFKEIKEKKQRKRDHKRPPRDVLFNSRHIRMGI